MASTGPATGTAARAARTAVLGAAVAVLGACSASSPSEPVRAAPGAGDPACTRAVATAPATVGGFPRTPLPVAGALAWGEPGIVLRCGLPEPAPTTKPCLGVNGVDWVFDADADPLVFVSYGRSPAVELRVPARYGRDAAVAAVTDVTPVAAGLPRTARACVGAADVTTPGTTAPGTTTPGTS